MLDCSEATICQLNKFYADETQFNSALCRLNALFISHNHLDHYFGLFGLIKRRREAFAQLGLPYEKLILIYPRTLNGELRGVPRILFFDSKDELLSLVRLVLNDSNNDLRDAQAYLGLRSFRTIPVEHIQQSYACLIELNDSQK